MFHWGALERLEIKRAREVHWKHLFACLSIAAHHTTDMVALVSKAGEACQSKPRLSFHLLAILSLPTPSALEWTVNALPCLP